MGAGLGEDDRGGRRQDWMLAGGPGTAAPSWRWRRGRRRLTADDGLLGVIAIRALALADREEAIEAWEHSLADAYSRGSLFAKKSVTSGTAPRCTGGESSPMPRSR